MALEDYDINSDLEAGHEEGEGEEEYDDYWKDKYQITSKFSHWIRHFTFNLLVDQRSNPQ